MKPQTLVALAATLEKEALKVTLNAGEYEINEKIELKIKGNLKILPDEHYTPTTSIPLIATLALFSEKAGITRETTKKLLIEALTQAEFNQIRAEGPIQERCRDIEKALKYVRKITQALPNKVRHGKIYSQCVIF